MAPPISGLSWWSPTMTEIGLPKTLPPKSSIAICAAVTEPWPVGVEAGPFMSVRTPILTTSSDTCASAAVDASIAAASAPNIDKLLGNIPSSPCGIGTLAVVSAGGCGRQLVSFATKLDRRQLGRKEGAVSQRYRVRFIFGPIQGIRDR